MGYSRDRERAVNYERNKMVKQGGDPDCANVIARELVRSDEDKARRKAGRKAGGKRLRMSFSKRNADDIPVPNDDVRFL
jgi:hypothetical protein